MSVIIEALRSAEAARKADLRATKPRENSTKGRNRRRSERRAFNAVIRVYGSSDSGKSFYIEARTIDVSTHGALLEMNVPVRVGQKLMLITEGTQRQQICQIVNTRVLETEALEVAVEFPVPHAEFWQIFSARPKMRSFENRRQPRLAEAGVTVGV
jgi:hypothetical protein